MMRHDPDHTRTVQIWIDNDEYLYDDARQAVTNAEALGEEPGEAIREAITENAPTLRGLYAELLSDALDSVDWDDIAEGIPPYEDDEDESPDAQE